MLSAVSSMRGGRHIKPKRSDETSGEKGGFTWALKAIVKTIADIY